MSTSTLTQAAHDTSSPPRTGGAAPVTDTRSEPETLGYLDARLLLAGFARAAAKACREGVPVRRLPDGASLYQLTGRPATAAASAYARVELLEGKLTELDQLVARARAIVLSTSDPDKVADYSAEEDRLRARRREVTAQLERARATSVEAPLAGPFHTYNEVVAVALAHLATGPKKISQAQYEALHTVMPELSLHRDDNGIWHAAATLRLGTSDDSVVAIGPIRWRVGAAGRGTTSIADRSFTFNEREPRAVLVTRLTDAGTLTRPALLSLLNALFPELPYVVLHGMDGSPFPDWVGPQWRAQPFVDWITGYYTDPDFRWANLGRYTTFSPERQLLAHLCARHDEVDHDLLRQHTPGGLTYGYARLTRTVRSKGRIPDWDPVVNVTMTSPTVAPSRPTTGTRRRRSGSATQTLTSSVYTGVRCDCGRIARVVARVPEVPRSLLCECGRMPDAARYGMPENVRFPAEYAQVLMLTMERCQALIEDKLIRSPQTPSSVLVTVMGHVDAIVDGISTPEMSERTGLSGAQVRAVLHRLAARGFLTEPGYGGIWDVRDADGLRTYATHVLTDDRTPISSENYRRTRLTEDVAP
ncbi:hypothetical protein ASH01_14335 [Terrabacter sp. Soil811]|uniref:hypothetical protein n=1 Tax=Terrabacter sp. Soil811 TaxID=1736419 RepID=UPI0006F579CC|nr:hypothetical protein [Terrabacter sp. Soil811]KRF45097.1 hypothetical protein ASH01_14335 [Terrabacter sp. Soil811]